ncbi:hypothetical protein ACHAQA_008511 [Verticillium albo-atrum]
MAIQGTDSVRAERLAKAFRDILTGRRIVSTATDARLCLEAVRAQSSPSSCLESMTASEHGLRAVSLSVRADPSTAFLTTHVLPFMTYLAHPDMKSIYEGKLLRQMLVAILQPPTAWNSLLNLWLNGTLQGDKAETFAWLSLEVVTFPGQEIVTIVEGLVPAMEERGFLEDPDPKVREFGYKIKKAIDLISSPELASTGESPGGRHDNDFVDFRQISVFPTTDELTSTLRPFLRYAADVAQAEPAARPKVHLDNQYRLLREDMLAELRADISAVISKKKGLRPAQILGQLEPVSIETKTGHRDHQSTLLVKCGKGLEILDKKSQENRKKILESNKKIVGHQSFGVLCKDSDIIGFAFILRDVDRLADYTVGLQFAGENTLLKALEALQTPEAVRFAFVDTPVFAYQPVLERLKVIKVFPLQRHLMLLSDDDQLEEAKPTISPQLSQFISHLKTSSDEPKKIRVGDRTVHLDASQTMSLSSALESTVSIIQGPPGTGKSFIGALAVRFLLQNPDSRLLVITYTNHALDQFLEDLSTNAGVSKEEMVRLGSKFTDATSSIRFDSPYRGCRQVRSKACYNMINDLKVEMSHLRAEIDQASARLGRVAVTGIDVLQYLEFSDQWQPFYEAFLMPEQEDGFVMAHRQVWLLSLSERKALFDRWSKEVHMEKVERLQTLANRFDEAQKQVQTLFDEAKRAFIQTKRIVGCTTTAASMFTPLLEAFKPDIVIVEEAGEILEAHVLAALQPCTKQLILIGDHKQLRPKINNYALTVEKGDGKQNLFEAQMVLKLVKYMGQQGYTTSELVVLTPYLGQLSLLREELGKENDPLLNDIDSAELVRAGLMTAAAGKFGKSKIRLSTIDNYQGEESDIVIASLTRSNEKGEIGFMKAPERLNVLVSRSRNCLIMIGNMETFMKNVQGKQVWAPFFGILKKNNYLQDGLWVHCEQHPEKIVMLSKPEDFELKCPDGGCSEPCGAKLRREAEEQRKKQDDLRRQVQRSLQLERERLARQEQYRTELQRIDDEIEDERQRLKDQQASEEQKSTLKQKQADLRALKETRARQEAMKKLEEKAKEVAGTHLPVPRSFPASEKSEPEPEAGNISAKKNWEQMKRVEHANSKALDTLMDLIGLEEVKRQFLSIKNKVDTALRQQVSLKSERFSCSLLGNPGTGKTTVARMYGKFLTSMGVIAGSSFEETTGSKLANMGVSGCQKLLDGVLNNGGGIVFIDEAYQLSSGNSPGGLAVLDFLLAEVENLTGTIVFVLAGYARQMETFFAHNPGFPSRFPLEMKFADYDDNELVRILERQINNKFGGRMKAENGLRGLFCRIVARRLGMGRGKEGFGNARAVENIFSRICSRQADRLQSERRNGSQPDDLLFTKTDLIGPEPANALRKSKAWGKLQSLIGLTSVKDSVRALVDSIQTNYQRELNEEPMIQFTLNRVFLGSPGTGKTTVAQIYGQILVDIGLLSNGEVIVKNPSDFVGAVIGASEQQTKGILAATAGKVLVIDEAYGLYSGGTKAGGFSDPFKTAVVDTIVAEVQSTPGDDRCVLLLGYKDQMEDMFQNVNPGLSRRFPLASAFVFEDFVNDELREILDLKLKQQGFTATDQAKNVAIEMLDRARNRPNFGNAGEIDILLNDAKGCHQKRLSLGQTMRLSTLEALDFDKDFDRAERSETNIPKLFEGTVGCEKIIATLQGYQDTVRSLKLLDMDPKEQIPFNFLFRGPPGTGKTSTARKMGKVFMDMGFLASAEVIDCSATDLIGQYIGQTGPKVQQLLDKALGRVLLVDEAYRLADGKFAKEALDEIVDAVTKEKYKQRLIIILAGYEDDINRLLNVNPGLTSRFPETIDFHSLSPTACFELLTRKLQGQKKRMEGKRGSLELSCLEQPTAKFEQEVLNLFGKLSKQASWASARDVETLARDVFNVGLKNIQVQGDAQIILSEGIVRGQLEKMLQERGSRGQRASLDPLATALQSYPMQFADSGTVQQPRMATEQAKNEAERKDELTPPTSPDLEERCWKTGTRDAGVSDEVWEQLQKDARAEEEREEKYQMMLKAKKSAADGERDRIARQLIAEEERREQEAKAKKRLETLGLCPAGYHWIKQGGGFRCAGGSHFVSEGQLD